MTHPLPDRQPSVLPRDAEEHETRPSLQRQQSQARRQNGKHDSHPSGVERVVNRSMTEPDHDARLCAIENSGHSARYLSYLVSSIAGWWFRDLVDGYHVGLEQDHENGLVRRMSSVNRIYLADMYRH